MNWGATDEFDQHIVGRHPNGFAQVKVATEEAAIRLSQQLRHSTVPPLSPHVTEFSNWLEARIQGAEVASWYTPGIRRDISRPAASAKAVE